MINYQNTLLSQYANSQTLLALIDGYSANLDISANIDAFYTNIWNIDTANGAGLDLLGRIVGVSRNIQVSSLTVGSSGYFGFAQQTGSVGFGQGVFYAPADALPVQYSLDDTAYRALLLIAAAANIGNCSIETLNKTLGQLFSAQVTASINGTTLTIASVQYGLVSVGQNVTGDGVAAGTYIASGSGSTWTVNNAQTVPAEAMVLSRGAAYVVNLGNMQMEIVCNFSLQPYELVILQYANVFPIPTGVGFTVVV